MARQVLTKEEIDAQEKLLRTRETVPLKFFGSRANDGNLTTAGGGFASFTADKDYAILGVFMSAMIFSVTTPLTALVALTRRDVHDHTASVTQGDDIAIMVFERQLVGFTVLGWGNVYLDKGQSIFAHLHSNSATGSSACTIVAYLQPTYKQ